VSYESLNSVVCASVYCLPSAANSCSQYALTELDVADDPAVLARVRVGARLARGGVATERTLPCGVRAAEPAAYVDVQPDDHHEHDHADDAAARRHADAATGRPSAREAETAG